MKEREVINLNEYKNRMPPEDFGEPEDITQEEMSDELLRAYAEASELETPDLWRRISDGFDEEIRNMREETRQKRARRKKHFSMMAAAVLVMIVAVPVLIYWSRSGNTKSSDSITEAAMDYSDAADEGMFVGSTEAAVSDMESECVQGVETNEAVNEITADAEAGSGKADEADAGFEDFDTDMAAPSSEVFYFATDIDAYTSAVGNTMYGQFEKADGEDTEYVFRISGFYSDFDENRCTSSGIRVGDEIIITNFDELINDEVDEETLLSAGWKVVFRVEIERQEDGRLQGAVKGYGPN